MPSVYIKICGCQMNERDSEAVAAQLVAKGYSLAPSETDADFAETLSLAREVEFDNAFVFKYSPRQGTPAARMPDPLPAEVIATRHPRLLALVNRIGNRNYERVVGQRAQVLVEGPSRRNARRVEGRTRRGHLVVFEGSAPPSASSLNCPSSAPARSHSTAT